MTLCSCVTSATSQQYTSYMHAAVERTVSNPYTSRTSSAGPVVPFPFLPVALDRKRTAQTLTGRWKTSSRKVKNLKNGGTTAGGATKNWSA